MGVLYRHMARPDQDPILRGMGPGEATCEMCLTHLYPTLPDDVCNGCALNPMTNGTMTVEEFVEASIKTASEKPLPQVKKE